MTLQKITPFLWFSDKAEEAMQFYVSIFKNSRIVAVQYYPEGSTEEHLKGMEGKVLTGVFELEGQRFMALDGGPVFSPSAAVSFLIQCDTQEEIDHYWNRLTEGGDPSAQQCGWLKDKYGFSWQVVPDMSRWMNDKDKERSGKAMHAMLEMKKIDIAKLEEAYTS